MPVVPFKAWHYEILRVTEGVRNFLGSVGGVKPLEELAAAGLAKSIVMEKNGDTLVLGVAGVVPLSGCSVGEVFVLVGDDARSECTREFVKSVKHILGEARKLFDRIEATGEDTPKLTRWFEFLGFERRGERDGRALWVLP